MNEEMITRKDLEAFKVELLNELRLLLQRPAEKRWLKSYEVRELLGISAGTLQRMRSTGKIAYSKMGGLIFYDYEDVVALMEGARRAIERGLMAPVVQIP